MFDAIRAFVGLPNVEEKKDRVVELSLNEWRQLMILAQKGKADLVVGYIFGLIKEKVS